MLLLKSYGSRSPCWRNWGIFERSANGSFYRIDFLALSHFCAIKLKKINAFKKAERVPICFSGTRRSEHGWFSFSRKVRCYLFGCTHHLEMQMSRIFLQKLNMLCGVLSAGRLHSPLFGAPDSKKRRGCHGYELLGRANATGYSS